LRLLARISQEGKLRGSTRLHTEQQSPPAVEKIPTIASSAVGARMDTGKKIRVDSLFANVKVSPLPHNIVPRAAYSLPKKTTLSNFSHHTSLTPQLIVAPPYASRAKPAEALPFDVNNALPPAPCVKGVMRKPPSPLLPASTLDNSVKLVGVRNPMKINDSLILNIVEGDGRMDVGAYEGRIQKEGVDFKHTLSENGLRVLPLNDELTQDHENNSFAERAMQSTKCSLCGEILPAGPQFLQLHEELYHFQEVIELD